VGSAEICSTRLPALAEYARRPGVAGNSRTYSFTLLEIDTTTDPA